MKKSVIILAMALGVIACNREELPVADQNDQPMPEQTTMTIIACTEDPNYTKTALRGNDTEGYDVLWSEGDQILIGSETFTLTEGAGTTKGIFSGKTLADGSYDAYYATSNDKVPGNQTYTAGKITNSPMMATVTVTDGEASIANFMNIGGLLHLTIKEVKPATIKSIKISGYFKSSSTQICLDCESSPVELTKEGSEFYIAMTEGSYTNVSIEMNTVSSGTLTKTLSKEKSLIINRSQITNASFKTNTLNDHEFVNLGISTGILWATCNLGAHNPEEVGTYFAWGETEGQDDMEFDWHTYKYGDSEYSLTKYCQYASMGEVDGKTTLDTDDDAAYKKWGEGWRMPTADDYQKLIDECYWEWNYQSISGYSLPNGWIVYKAKNEADKGKMCDSNGDGKIQGYSLSDTHIFFPVSGRILDGKTEYPGDCYYWTSSLWSGYSYSAQNFAGSSLNRFVDEGHYYRCTGEPIRAVCE